jgi:hypothetical protein
VTIREWRQWVPGDKRYEAICVRCGEHVAEFNDPEHARDAVEAQGGQIVKDAYYVTDCIVSCANCLEKCLCPICSTLLEGEACPNCPDAMT